MREIKFRGKQVDNGECVYGSVVNCFNATLIAEFPIHKCLVDHRTLEVIEDTVSQFIGKLDMNKKEIYQGDILSTKERDVFLEIVWNEYNCCFLFRNIKTNSNYEIDISTEVLEVIGNIHDNPELLENKS